MKTPSIIAAFLSILAYSAPSARADGVGTARDLEIRAFEERYINTLPYRHANDTTKLIGYKKILLTPAEVADLQDTISADPEAWSAFANTYLDRHAGQLRVYFPVEGALMHHAGGALIEANEYGEYPCTLAGGTFEVLGRYRTPDITGVETNIIRDGVIYLGSPSPSLRRHGEWDNIHVYDFGWKDLSLGHHHHHNNNRRDGGVSRRADKVSCMNNHGGPNCSDKFGIHKGRCPFHAWECMDYNGWPIKDCKGKGKKGFVGSDCFIALGRGKCWNEVM